jgi:hypothetical protein
MQIVFSKTILKNHPASTGGFQVGTISRWEFAHQPTGFVAAAGIEPAFSLASQHQAPPYLSLQNH